LIAFVPPFLVGIAYRVFFLNKVQDKSRPVLNLFVAALAGASRNLSVGALDIFFGTDDDPLWLFRFVGGSVIGVAIFMIWSLSQGTTGEYNRALRKLAKIQTQLAKTRETLPEMVEGVNESIQARTRSAVLPQFEAISNALGASRSAELALGKLRETLSEKVRPILRELTSTAPEPFKQRDIETMTKLDYTLPKKYRLHESISIIPSTLSQSIGYAFWLTLFFGFEGFLLAVITMCIYGITLFGLKFLVPKQQEFTRTAATLLTIGIGAISSLGTVFFIGTLEISQIEFLAISGISVFSGILAPVIITHTNARAERQKQIEQSISNELISIAKQNALFAQKVWLFRKRWLLLLHGTVQSALTAAVTRLQGQSEIDEFTVQMVKQDLLRAEQAITGDVQKQVVFSSTVDEIIELWRGICNVSVQVSERARRAMERNSDTSFCVNEIIKEAISNAVRHGSANNAKVFIDRVVDDLLEVSVTNDGSTPKSSTILPGIGSEMLDEICLSWSLEGKAPKVKLSATLPLAL
jgi:signal transduction histidine kinase